VTSVNAQPVKIAPLRYDMGELDPDSPTLTRRAKSGGRDRCGRLAQPLREDRVVDMVSTVREEVIVDIHVLFAKTSRALLRAQCAILPFSRNLAGELDDSVRMFDVGTGSHHTSDREPTLGVATKRPL
jgi:hypothetical protein